MQKDSLQTHYDQTFSEKNGELYEPLSGMDLAAHQRRMELLAAIDLPDLADKTVVDFGVGSWGFGCVYPRLKQCRHAIGYDISKIAVERSKAVSEQDPDLAHAHVEFFVSDGYALNLPDNSVDIYFSGECIEHIEDTPSYLREVHRVLKPDGIAIFTTPNASPFLYRNIGLKWCVGFEHVALMNFDELDAALRQFFSPEKYYGFNQSFLPGLDACVDDQTQKYFASACEHEPHNATSLIAVVKKVGNKRYPPIERSIVEWRSAGSTGQVHELDLVAGITGGMIEDNACFTIPVPRNMERCNLIFWAHSWSGYAEVTCGATRRTVNLYSHVGGCERLVLTDLKGDTIMIRPLAIKDPRSAAAQVIFYRAVFASNSAPTRDDFESPEAPPS